MFWVMAIPAAPGGRNVGYASLVSTGIHASFCTAEPSNGATEVAGPTFDPTSG